MRAKRGADWRQNNAVTSVKDQVIVGMRREICDESSLPLTVLQRDCNACWAFAAAGAIEGAVALSGKGLQDLSEQQLINCAGGCTSGGEDVAFERILCSFEGWTAQAYDYTQKNGLPTSSTKPYTNSVRVS